MNRNEKNLVIGVRRIPVYVSKTSGETYPALSVSLGVISADYEGRQARTEFFRVGDLREWDWLQPGVYVDLEYEPMGRTGVRLVGIYPVD